MKYKCNIHKRVIYIKPRPKEDIKQGLVIVLNKPIHARKEPIAFTDIFAGQKDYDLPDLPSGVYVKQVFVKDDKRNPKNTE